MKSFHVKSCVSLSSVLCFIFVQYPDYYFYRLWWGSIVQSLVAENHHHTGIGLNERMCCILPKYLHLAFFSVTNCSFPHHYHIKDHLLQCTQSWRLLFDNLECFYHDSEQPKNFPVIGKKLYRGMLIEHGKPHEVFHNKILYDKSPTSKWSNYIVHELFIFFGSLPYILDSKIVKSSKNMRILSLHKNHPTVMHTKTLWVMICTKFGDQTFLTLLVMSNLALTLLPWSDTRVKDRHFFGQFLDSFLKCY